MKAVRLNELGGPEKLHVEEIPQPSPAVGEILVRIKRAAFNRRDVFITQNLYPGIVLPRTLGSDGCGEIAALAKACGPPVGTRVVIDPQIGWDDDPQTLNKNGSILGMPHDGTFAQYVVVPAGNVYAKPSRSERRRGGGDAARGADGLPRDLYARSHYEGRRRLVPGVGSGVQTFVLLYAVARRREGRRHLGQRRETRTRQSARRVGSRSTTKPIPTGTREARKLTDGGPSLVVDSTGGETLARASTSRATARAS